MPPSHSVYLDPRRMVILMSQDATIPRMVLGNEVFAFYFSFPFGLIRDDREKWRASTSELTTEVQRKGVSGVHRHVRFYNSFFVRGIGFGISNYNLNFNSGIAELKLSKI